MLLEHAMNLYLLRRTSVNTKLILSIKLLRAKLNPICSLLALFGAHHILHVSR